MSSVLYFSMADVDRLSFLSEWQDPFSSVNWKFTLFFYPSDETIELFDTMKHRLFLKRRKCESVQSEEDLFIGATLRICSRLIRITDYADSYTRTKMEPTFQKISGFLKPEVATKGLILKSFIENNFRVINLRSIVLSELEAYELLRDYPDEAILNLVVEHVTSGPIVAFQLLRRNALIECLNLVGPEDPIEAKQKFPDSLRARFGTDKIKNALYVSSSLDSAEKDAKILFHSKNYLCNYLNPILGESICCVIKPHAVKNGLTGAIIARIEGSGYQIINLSMCTMSATLAEQFLEVYKYVAAEYQEMVQELCSGSCVALEIQGVTEDKTFTNFRCLVGPMDPEIGKCIRPDTIRAIFGETKIRNCIHVTDLMEDRARENELKGPGFIMDRHMNNLNPQSCILINSLRD